MVGYVLSILGIIVAGVFIDIIVPSGSINKYIKGIYSIFVVAVMIGPLVKLLAKKGDLTLKYEEYQINETLLTYIHENQAKSMELEMEQTLDQEGFANIDIILNFSSENNELNYLSCQVNLKNLVISADKQHINKYEFIKEIIKNGTNLTDEEIIIDEW